MKAAKKQFLLILTGSVLCLDSLILLGRTNGNLGIYLPLFLGAPLLFLGLFYRKLQSFFEKKAGRILKKLLFLGYSLLLVFFGSLGLFLHHAGSMDAPKDADALIILGCGIFGERPSLTLKRRLDVAHSYLLENPNTLCIVSGGQGNGERISEAEAMKRYLVEQGIPEERILMEDQSRSTHENFLFSKVLIDTHCPPDPSLVYVSTRFHVFRAGRVAQKVGIQASGIGSLSLWYIALNDYMRECLAVTGYWFLGRI